MSEIQTRRPPHLVTAAIAAGAVLTVLADLVQPHSADGGRGLVAAVSAHPDRWMLGYSLQLVAVLPMLAGVVGLAARVEARGRTLTRIGACIFAIGLVGVAAMAATELMLVPVATGPHAAAVTMADRMDQSAALVVVFALALPGMFFGVPLLALGLARAGETSWTLAGIAVVATVVGFPATGTPVGTVALAVQGAALVAFAAGVSGRVPDSSAPAREPARA